MTPIPGSKCGFLVCRLLPPNTTGEAGSHPLCQVWSQGGTFSHFLQFCFLQHFLGNFSNSQMGKADSLRSSKKPVASEGLSMFVVNWCFYISPSSSSAFHSSVSDQTTTGWAASVWGGEQLCLQKRPNTCSFRPGRILFCLGTFEILIPITKYQQLTN